MTLLPSLVVNSEQWQSHCTYLEVKSVIGVRHEPVLVGTLQLETMRDPSVRCADLAIAVEVGQTVAVAQLLKVFVCAVHPTCAQVLHNTYNRNRNSLNMSDPLAYLYLLQLNNYLNRWFKDNMKSKSTWLTFIINVIGLILHNSSVLVLLKEVCFYNLSLKSTASETTFLQEHVIKSKKKVKAFVHNFVKLASVNPLF